jgi:hypothetical protein
VEVESGAEPRLREGEDDQCDRIPMSAEVAVPSGDGSNGTEDNADATADQRVAHGTVRSKPCGGIATDDAEDSAIGSGEEKRLIGNVLAEGWENAELVKERVGDNGENHDNKKPSEESPDALTEATGLRRCDWRRRH